MRSSSRSAHSLSEPLSPRKPASFVDAFGPSRTLADQRSRANVCREEEVQKLIVNSDAHAPGPADRALARRVAPVGAGLGDQNRIGPVDNPLELTVARGRLAAHSPESD